MKSNKMISYPLILGVVSLVAGLLLALVYNITEPIIESNKNKRENAIVLEMFGEDSKIRDSSNSLNEDEKEAGIYSVLEVKSDNKTYYVYKATIVDPIGGEESSFVLALNDRGKISDIRFTEIGDSYASSYTSNSFKTNIKGKGELSSSDKVSGSTKTGDVIREAINSAIGHYGREK